MPEKVKTHLLLIPGMMCDQRLFAPQIKALQSPTLEITVPLITEFDSVEQLSIQILTKAPQTFALAGLSMGGIVAMEIYRQAPNRIEKLALMDTNPLAELEEVKAKRLPQIAKVKAGKLKAVMRDEMKPNYLSEKLTSSRRKKVLDLCMDMALKLGDDVFIRQSIALRNRPDQCQSLKKLTCPTLILHGESDTLCPAHRHELLHQLIPHAHYTVIENAGHLPTLENPQAVNQALGNWLSQ